MFLRVDAGRCFHGTWLKHLCLRKSEESHNCQVPFAGAQIDFYGQGATLGAGNPSSIPPNSPTTLNVYAIGALKSTNQVQVGLGGPTITVTSVDNINSRITVQNSGASIPISEGVRLILLTAASRPVLYKDPFGATPVAGNNFLTADSKGRAQAYIDNRLYDYVTGSQDPPSARLVIDAEGSALSSSHLAPVSSTTRPSRTRSTIPHQAARSTYPRAPGTISRYRRLSRL